MDPKAQHKPAEKSTNDNISSFDFDQWAVQVKRQMIAALHRRGVR